MSDIANYTYIIASFPDIVLDFKSGGFDYASLEEEVKSLCSEKDCKLLEWLDFGLTDGNASNHFYRAVAKKGNRFLTDYFKFDKELRTAKVDYLTSSKCPAKFEKIFNEKNLIEREKQIDLLRWNFIGEDVEFELFNMNVILSFMAKARIVERWNRLDQQTGEDLFRSLVQEVRGTFKGIKETTI